MRRALASLLAAVAILIADPAIVGVPLSHSIPIEAPLAALAIAAPVRRYLRKQQVADRYQTTTRNVELKVADGTPAAARIFRALSHLARRFARRVRPPSRRHHPLREHNRIDGKRRREMGPRRRSAFRAPLCHQRNYGDCL
jgi:hypothetical protein